MNVRHVVSVSGKTNVCFRVLDSDMIWDDTAGEWADDTDFADSVVEVTKGAATNVHEVELPDGINWGRYQIEIFYDAAAAVDADTVPDGNIEIEYRKEDGKVYVL